MGQRANRQWDLFYLWSNSAGSLGVGRLQGPVSVIMSVLVKLSLVF